MVARVATLPPWHGRLAHARHVKIARSQRIADSILSLHGRDARATGGTRCPILNLVFLALVPRGTGGADGRLDTAGIAESIHMRGGILTSAGKLLFSVQLNRRDVA